PPPPSSTLFPYTTLFRSPSDRCAAPPRWAPGRASARTPAAGALPFAVPRAVAVPRIAVPHAPLLQQLERAVAFRAGPLPAHSRRAAHGADRADACVRRGAARRPRAPADAAGAPAGVVEGGEGDSHPAVDAL